MPVPELEPEPPSHSPAGMTAVAAPAPPTSHPSRSPLRPVGAMMTWPSEPGPEPGPGPEPEPEPGPEPKPEPEPEPELELEPELGPEPRPVLVLPVLSPTNQGMHASS